MHQAFAESRGAYQGPNFVILYGPCQDLGSAGRPSVYQDEQGFVNPRALGRITGFLKGLALDGYHVAFGDEHPCDVNAPVQQPASVIAQVQDDCFGTLTLEFLHGFRHGKGGSLVERYEFDVPYPFFFHLILHCSDGYVFPYYGYVKRVSVPVYGERHLGACRPPDQGCSLVTAGHRLAVNFDYEIVDPEPRSFSRRTLHRRYDAYPAVLIGDGYPYP